MSLVGNLQDFGLSDILEIVSLSRKSGVLSLNNGDEEGRFIFRNGRLVRCISSDIEEDTRGTIRASALISDEQLDAMMILYEETNRAEKIDLIMNKMYGISQESIEAVKKKNVEDVAYSFFEWTSGAFNFELQNIDEFLSGNADLFIYDSGINSQSLAIEGARLHGEKKNDIEGNIYPSSNVEKQKSSKGKESVDISLVNNESFHDERNVKRQDFEPEGILNNAWGQSSNQTISKKKDEKVIIVVDDDINVIDAIKSGLSKKGYTVFAETQSEKALHAISQHNFFGTPIVVISDLLMPRMDGSGFLGGIELLELLESGLPKIPVILMSDYVNDEAHKKAINLGVTSYISKPKRGEFASPDDNEKINLFLGELSDILNPLFGESPTSKEEGKTDMFDLSQYVQKEFKSIGEILPLNNGSFSLSPTPGLSSLKSITGELNSPEGRRQIILLILRFLSELMNRGLLFIAKKDKFEGLGQFGVEIENDFADNRIKSMTFSRDIPSILKEAVDSKKNIKKKMEDLEGNRYIIEQCGGKTPKESFAAPIMTDGNVCLVVYCDNLPEYKEIGDTSALEMFLIQSGVAMEKALLERKVREISKN